MSLLKIIFLLLSILSFSCQTRLEKEGWQRTAIVSGFDTSTINKREKEVFVVKIQDMPSVDSAGKIINKPLLVHGKKQVYTFNVFVRDSTGKIISEPVPIVYDLSLKSDIAYYKWESDSLCMVKILNHGNVKASFKIRYSHNSKGVQYLDESKK